MISSLRDRPLPADLIAVGEVGLSGELRSVGQLEPRLREAAQTRLSQRPGARASSTAPARSHGMRAAAAGRRCATQRERLEL